MSADAAVATPAARRQMGLLAALLASARPRQWTKNVIVFGPPVFAYKLLAPELLVRAMGAFVAFCLVSSATYVLNDLFDADSDRQHPLKRDRPLARGDVSSGQAAGWAAVLTVGGLALAFAVNLEVGLAAAGYMALMLAYSSVLKHAVILDVFAIAAGFILRAVAGALAIHVIISPWLYVCTLLRNLGGAPELILLRDIPLMADIVLWGLTSVAVLYVGGR